MKSALFLALAITLVAAIPQPKLTANSYSIGDWFVANFNVWVLSIIIPIYAGLGYLTAFFGSYGWFDDHAPSVASGAFALPAYEGQGFNIMWESMLSQHESD